MKSGESFLVFVFAIFFFGVGFGSTFSGSGSGTSGDPFEITNCTQLQEMNDNLTAHYELTNNIDCSDTVNWNSGAGFLPVANGSTFQGTLNGNDYNISDLYINRPSSNNTALIALVTENTVIRNLGMVDANVTGNAFTAGFMGSNSNGSASNLSFFGGTVSGGDFVGSMAGDSDGNITNSHSRDCSVNGSTEVGGVSGGDNQGNFSSISVTNCQISGLDFVGGVFGSAVSSSSTMTNVSSINNTVSGNDTVGGIAGSSGKNFSNSHSVNITVNATGSNVGGLVGHFLEGGIVNNTYSLHNIVFGAGKVGGLIGLGSSNVSDSYATNVTVNATDSDSAGLVAYLDDGADVFDSNVTSSTITGQDKSAGLLGRVEASGSNVSRSHSSNNRIVGRDQTGGTVGNNKAGNFELTYSLNNYVEGNQSVGGFGGQNTGVINRTYSLNHSLNVTGDWGGGHTGINWHILGVGGTVTYSYASGNNTLGFKEDGTHAIAGFLGVDATLGVFLANHWDVGADGNVTKDIGNLGNVSGISGNTTAQMKSISTYVGWDFNNTWIINSTIASTPCFNYTGFCLAEVNSESCNLVDDDNNGLVDDGLGTLSCGVGACSVTIDSCIVGVSQTCVPLASSAEICDGVDNDCDGVIDESVCGSSSGSSGGGGGVDSTEDLDVEIPDFEEESSGNSDFDGSEEFQEEPKFFVKLSLLIERVFLKIKSWFS